MVFIIIDIFSLCIARGGKIFILNERTNLPNDPAVLAKLIKNVYRPKYHLQDIDECTDGSHDCGEQKCYNLPGGFQCAKIPTPRRKTTTITTTTTAKTLSSTTRAAPVIKCDRGYKYNATRKICMDVNECRESSPCNQYAGEECVNTLGGYNCTCRRGYRYDDNTQGCVDVNECLLHNDCHVSQRCDNTIGSYACVRFLPCGTGYTLNAATETCEDDDECSLNTHDCGAGYHCRNTLGSYRCDRDRGRGSVASTTTTTRRSTARRIQQRPVAADTTAIARRTTETTPNQITTNQDAKIALPVNNFGPTFTTSSTTEPVPTVGTLIPSITTQKSKFNAVAQRPRIDCGRGFEVGPLGECMDIDECRRTIKICGIGQYCVNTFGSYRCESRTICGVGYAPDHKTGRCVDVNECAEGNHKCANEQTCENRPGGYVCYCPSGYEVGRDNNCIDIDECKRAPGLCGNGGDCLNTPGSYDCVCKNGFENNRQHRGARSCTDIDECKTIAGVCQQECYNIWGGYRCGCHFGYNLRNDNRTCEDVDECNVYKDDNLCVGICDNTPGSYGCRCPEGYKLGDDGRTCVDIDECTTGNVCGNTNDLCVNLRGGFRCNRIKCPAGYHRDPTRINRCMRDDPNCLSTDQACIQRPLHFTYNYLAITSMYPIPVQTSQVELFTMRGSYSVPNSSTRFGLNFINARSPPLTNQATEACFALRRPFPSQAVLVLTKSIQGPQDVELELTMEVYGPNDALVGSAVAKIYIIVTQYEY